MTKQLSVFVENREGSLEEVLSILKEQKINIISLSLADTSEYGILRMIVSDPDTAKEALKSNGFSALLTEVIVVKLSHRVGFLQELLTDVCQAGINIEYMYALSTGTDDASIVIKASDMDKAEKILKEAGVSVLASAELGI